MAIDFGQNLWPKCVHLWTQRSHRGHPSQAAVLSLEMSYGYQIRSEPLECNMLLMSNITEVIQDQPGSICLEMATKFG